MIRATNGIAGSLIFSNWLWLAFGQEVETEPCMGIGSAMHTKS